MKVYINRLLTWLIAVPTLFLSSCNFLDIDPYLSDEFTIDSVFIKKEYTEKYLRNIYSELPVYSISNFYVSKSMPYSVISDEGLSTLNKSGSHQYSLYANDLLTPADFGRDRFGEKWNTFYRGIRKANVFINGVKKTQGISELVKSEWTGEALFLKANFYFELMLAFGPVPIVPDDPVTFDTPIDELMLERNTWDECSAYVSKLLEEAHTKLPDQLRDRSEFGKPTKNSALAVLSRLSLYSASPLYNGENSEFVNLKKKDGTPLLNNVKDMQKWAIAAANAKRLVDKKPNDLHIVPKLANTPFLPVPSHEQLDYPNGVGGIDPYHSYKDMFDGESALPSENPEILFCQVSADFQERYLLPRMLDGWGDQIIPQNLVDAYYMADGRTIQDASADYPYSSGFSTNEVVFSGGRETNGVTILSSTHNWYANREMRFYATIGYNNSYYPSTSTPPHLVDPQDNKVAKFYRDSKSGKDFALTNSNADPEDYPMSGYLNKKFIHYEDSFISGGRRRKKIAISYRMAEVYLNYVEAINELDKAYTINDVSVSRDVKDIKHYFNLIRYRAGLPGITDADAGNVSKMRELIAKERRVEFAWEQRRYHDLRRTKKASYYENQPLTGVNVDAVESKKEDFYSIIRLTMHRPYLFVKFTDRRTFLPIPKAEIDKNRNLQQNLGY